MLYSRTAKGQSHEVDRTNFVSNHKAVVTEDTVGHCGRDQED